MTNDDLLYRTAVSSELTGASLLRLLSGDEYDVGALWQGISNGTTKRLVLRNDSTDQVVLILQPSVHATAKVYFRRTQNMTIDTVGNERPTVNSKTDEPNDPPVTSFTAGDGETGVVSGGEDHPRLTAGSGSNASNAGAGASEGASITNVVMPGDSFMVSAQNSSGAAIDLSLSWVFVMIPESELARVPYE